MLSKSVVNFLDARKEQNILLKVNVIVNYIGKMPNITFYKSRIKKLSKLRKSGKSKYSDKKLENWIIGCKTKIEKLRKNKPKTKRANRTK